MYNTSMDDITELSVVISDKEELDKAVSIFEDHGFIRSRTIDLDWYVGISNEEIVSTDLPKEVLISFESFECEYGS